MSVLTPLRVLILLLGLLSLHTHTAWFRLQHKAVDPVPVLVAGLAALGLQVQPPDGQGFVAATAPGCPAPLVAGLFAIDGGEHARYAQLLGPGTDARFVYMGQVAPYAEELHAPRRWAMANAQALLGLRNKPVPTKMVLVALPAACPQLMDEDWKQLQGK